MGMPIWSDLGMFGSPTPTPTPTSTLSWVDPDAATLVLAPGVVPTPSSNPISIVTGSAVDIPLQSWNRGSLSTPVFGANDTLAAAIYQSRISTPIFTPECGWYTAGSSQTGYGQGQTVTSVTDAQAALLVPTIRYSLSVSWTPAADPSKTVVIARVPLVIEPIAIP